MQVYLNGSNCINTDANCMQMNQYGSDGSILIQMNVSESEWVRMDQIRSERINMDTNWCKWIRMDQNGSIWIQMNANRCKRMHMDQNGSECIKWNKIDQNGS